MNFFEKIINPKIGVYTENGNTYMSIDATVICKDENKFNKCSEVDISIPKVDLQKAVLELSNKTVGIYGFTMPFKVEYDHKISFPIIPNGKSSVLFSVKDKPKEMTKKEIEKELGYKISIIEN